MNVYATTLAIQQMKSLEQKHLDVLKQIVSEIESVRDVNCLMPQMEMPYSRPTVSPIYYYSMGGIHRVYRAKKVGGTEQDDAYSVRVLYCITSDEKGLLVEILSIAVKKNSSHKYWLDNEKQIAQFLSEIKVY